MSTDTLLPARAEMTVAERLNARPIFDGVNPNALALLKKSKMQRLSNAEMAMALELAAHYDLDPFAGEIWATRGEARDGKEGQLLIMVGRDGLRKIVMRNGLSMDGDVVRERDTFRVVRETDRTRTIQHAYEEARREDAATRGDAETPEASSRGRIVGAWAEVWDRSGKQCGFFYAPMAEYVPKSEKKLRFSPWGSQESVMILAAAERQAARQATPLSGLLMEGEMDLNDERAIDASTAEDDAALQAVIDSVDAPEELRDRLYEAVKEGNALAPNSFPAMKVQLLVAGKTEEALLEEVEQMERQNAAHRERLEEEAAARRAAEQAEAENVTDAVVVPEGELSPEETAVKAEAWRNTIADLEAALEDPDAPDRENLQGKLDEATLALRELTGEE